MKTTRLLVPTFAMTLLASAGTALAQYYPPYYGPAPSPYWYDRAERYLEHRGFEDGILGAERDFQNHRRPDVNNRDEYRSPYFGSPWAQHEYREGFRRGYYMRARQIYQSSPRYYGDYDRDDYR